MRDLVLEGVRPDEIAALLAITEGHVVADRRTLLRLEAKGWVDVFAGEPVLTIAGATLIKTVCKG